jgi:hypothetical protein
MASWLAKTRSTSKAIPRGDRGVQDESDVIAILKLQKSRLDYEYLAKRAQAANVTGLLRTLMDQV